MATPTIVQSTTCVPGATTNTMTVTFSTQPTLGNLLLLFFSFSQYGSTRAVTLPDSYWTTADSYNGTGADGDGNDSLAIIWRIVRSGDGTSYSFNLTNNGTSDWLSAVIYEISGASSSTPINQVSITDTNDSAPFTPPPLTPSVVGTLPFLAASSDYGPNSIASITSGWTAGPSAAPSYHSTYLATGPLTTNTTTAIAPSITMTYQDSGLAALVLIAPGSGSSPVFYQRMSLLGCGS